MKINKSFNLFFYIFIFLLIFLVSTSFHNYFGQDLNRYYPDIYPYNCHYKLSFEMYNECRSKNIWYKYIWAENGLVENLQILLLIICIIFIIINLFKLKFKNKRIFKIFLILHLLGLLYIFFEEISWLQHFLNYKTPEIIGTINNQKEFNLHNISNIFNEIPRALVLIWCSFSGISYFLLKNKISNEIKIILKPSNKILFISLILIIFTLPDLVVDKFNLLDWSLLHLNYAGNAHGHENHMIYSPLVKEGYNIKQFMIIFISSNYFRFSEFQELIFYYFFLWHTIYVIYNIKILLHENRNNNF